jgi:hypothetical protein
VSVPLRHTVARSVLATQHSPKWLAGVEDMTNKALTGTRDGVVITAGKLAS